MIVRVVTKKRAQDAEDAEGREGGDKEDKQEEEELDYESVFEKVYRKRESLEKRCKLLNVAKVVLLKPRYRPLLEFPPLSGDDPALPPAKEEEEGDQEEREYDEMRKLVDAALADKTAPDAAVPVAAPVGDEVAAAVAGDGGGADHEQIRGDEISEGLELLREGDEVFLDEDDEEEDNESPARAKTDKKKRRSAKKNKSRSAKKNKSRSSKKKRTRR